MATTVKVKTKAPNDSSNKYNTSTGKLNPNYKAPSTNKVSSGSNATKELQKKINQMGAKVPGFKPIAVDGIAGANTKREMLRFGLSSDSAGFEKFASSKVTPKQTITPIKQTQGTSYSNVGSTSSFSKFLSSQPTKSSNTKQNSSPFGMISDWVKRNKDSLFNKSASAGYIPKGDTNTVTGVGAEKPYGALDYVYQPKESPKSDIPVKRPFEIAKDFGKEIVNKVGSVASNVVNKLEDSLSSEITYNASDYANDPSSQNYELPSSSMNQDYPGTGISSDGTRTVETTSTDENGNEVITTDETPLIETNSNGYSSSSVPSSSNTGINNVLMGVDSKVDGIRNDPFISDKTKADKLRVTEMNLTNELAGNFQSYDQLNSWLSSQGGSEKLRTLNQKNGTNLTKEGILSKISPVVNGLTPPKTPAEFLAYKNKELEDERKILNETIAIENNLNQSQRDILLGKKDEQGNDILLGVAEQEKREADTMTAFLDKQLANQERSLKQKAQWMIDKAEAEFKTKDAETELNRIKAKSSLTEFLAQIGALRTDGNALTGLETLEQSYQAQRQALRQDFNMAKREINMNMNDNIYDLESARDEKVFKLNQDLNKTEREVTMEVMKLDYDLQKDMLNIKMKWSDAIRTQKERAEARAEKLSNDWTSQFFTISGAAQFKQMPNDFQAEWMKNNYFGKTPNGYKTDVPQLGQQFSDYEKANPGKQPGDLSPANITKAENYIYNNSKDVQTDLEKFKTDRAFQAWVLNQE